jgi:hypothetical protein
MQNTRIAKSHKAVYCPWTAQATAPNILVQLWPFLHFYNDGTLSSWVLWTNITRTRLNMFAEMSTLGASVRLQTLSVTRIMVMERRSPLLVSQNRLAGILDSRRWCMLGS